MAVPCASVVTDKGKLRPDAGGPFVGPRKDQFAVRFAFDVTNKPSGQRMQMTEVALYTVNRAGKIKQEEFLYLMG